MNIAASNWQAFMFETLSTNVLRKATYSIFYINQHRKWLDKIQTLKFIFVTFTLKLLGVWMLTLNKEGKLYTTYCSAQEMHLVVTQGENSNKWLLWAHLKRALGEMHHCEREVPPFLQTDPQSLLHVPLLSHLPIVYRQNNPAKKGMHACQAMAGNS